MAISIKPIPILENQEAETFTAQADRVFAERKDDVRSDQLSKIAARLKEITIR